MEVVQAIILGVTQGLTEFLPISSSAHLVLVPKIISVTHINSSAALAFDTLLHFGTLAAVIGSFWKELVKIIKALLYSIQDLFQGKFLSSIKEDPFKRLAWLIVVGTIPAALTGILFKSQFESIFNSVAAVGFFLIITGIILWLAERVKPGEKEANDMSFKNALAIGISQALALVPGISRSGATISAGLFSGLNREFSAKYSFLLAIPAIMGATAVQIKDIGAGFEANTLTLVAGFLAALISGYLAIGLLLRIIRERTMMIFAYYCWIVGSVTLILSYVNVLT